MSEHHHHHHHHTHAVGRRLQWALMLTLGFALVEAVGGWLSGSLALLGDAGHMVTDAFALGIAAIASWAARRPPSERHSYGFGRLEALAALLNALFMLGVVISIAIAAYQRLLNPQPVAGVAVMVVAAIGMLINIGVAWILEHGESDLNVRGALLHVMGDLLGSVAALIAGAVIFFTGWTPIDPLLAILVCGLILYSTFSLLKDATHVMLEGVPRNIDLNEVGQAMAAVEGVRSVHDLHIWSVSSGNVALSAHIELTNMAAWNQILAAQSALLNQRFGISHVTLQPELAEFVLERR